MKKIINVLILTILPMCFATASYMPRVYLTGAAGSNVLGKADILAPIYSTNTNNLFVYAQGKYAYEEQTWEDNTWTGSFGLGYRHILNNTFMLGAYGLADYTTATSGYKFWVLSPGIEGYTQNWEFRANGYFPQNKKRWVDEGWASDFGDYQYIQFSGHQQWDQKFKYYQETGNGADVEVGRVLYKYNNILFKGYVNGFYNNMQDNDDLYGAGARLSVEPNNYLKFVLAYAYDNYEHNALMAGVQVSIYDIFNPGKASQELQQNLFKPIERNFATIDSGSSVRITRGDKLELIGEALRYDNVWFFGPGAASGSNAVGGDGTIEHPFTAFNIDSFNMINPAISTQATKLYFAANNTFNLGTFSGYRFELPANWMMQGWVMAPGIMQNNHPAEGNARPLFIGGFQLNNNTSINNLRLENDQNATEMLNAVVMRSAINVNISNVKIGPYPAVTANTTYLRDVYMNDDSSLSVSDSQLNATGDGIRAISGGSGSITIKDITNTEFNVVENGIFVDRYGICNLIISNINNSTFNTGYDGIYVTNLGNSGIGNANNATSDLIISNINNSTFNTGHNGIYVYLRDDNDNLTISNINNSTFNTGYDGIYVNLCDNNDNLIISNINNSTFNTGYGGIRARIEEDAGTGNLTISNINNSTFNTGYDGISTTVISTEYNLIISNINNSTFNTLESGIRAFNGEPCNTGVLTNNNGDFIISNINNSTFNTGVCGINAIRFDKGDLTINNINNSTFNTGYDGIKANNHNSGAINLNQITGNIFKSLTKSCINLINGTSYTINGVGFKAASQERVNMAYAALLEANNILEAPITGNHLDIDNLIA